MKILHVLDHSVPLHSGYTFRTMAILREQRRLGWETAQITGPKQGGDRDMPLEEHVDGLEFFRTPVPSAGLPGLNEVRLMAALARRLATVARRVRPDVLHAHSPALNVIPTLWVGSRLGIPVVYEVRAFWEDAAVDHGTTREGGLRYRLTRGLETWALRRAAAVTTICEGLSRDIIARNVPAERVTVIPNAVDIDRFRRGSLADPVLRQSLGLNDARVLGFVGSFYAYEGLDLLLHSVPLMQKVVPDLRVLLVGGGPQEQGLKALAGALGIADRVVFTGRVPHEEVGRYYDLIDILVYPRRSMRLTDLVTPLKPLEAMAQGRLLAASDVGGHRELIRDGETGILFRAGDSEALARSILDLLAAEGSWPALRERARQFVEAERSWPLSVARYEQVYGRLVPALFHP